MTRQSEMRSRESNEAPTGMRRWWSQLSIRHAVVTVVVLILLFLCLSPVIYLIRDTFFPAGGFSFEGFERAVSTYNIAELSWHTLQFAAGATIVSVALGTFLAWYTERTDLPFKGVVFVAALVPLIVPALLYAIAWVLLLSPRTGLIAEPLNALLGGEVVTVFSMPAMILVQGLDNAPLAFLLMVAAFRTMDPSLEESAQTSGASPWAVFRRVTLPLARPGLLAALLIVGVRSIEAFEIPALLGPTAGISVFSTRIWQVMSSWPPDYAMAGAYAVILLVACGLLVYAQGRYLGRGRRFATVTGKGFRSGHLRITGRARPVLSSVVVAYVFATLIAPVGILAYASTQPFYSSPSIESIGRLTLDSYKYVLTHSQTSTALANSLLLAVGAATATMALCAVAAWVVVRQGTRGGWLLDNLTFAPFVFPGIVLGVALLSIYLRTPLPIFGTLWILLIAYVTKFIPYGMRYAVSAMYKINAEMEEAGDVAGARWGQVFRRITAPLMMPGLIAGWIYVAIVSLRELSSSILLYSPGTEVVAIVIFDMWENGQISQLAAFGIILIVLSLVLVLIGRRIGSGIGVEGSR